MFSLHFDYNPPAWMHSLGVNIFLDVIILGCLGVLAYGYLPASWQRFGAKN